MSVNISRHDGFITLHDMTGQPLRLRTKFIIAVCSYQNNSTGYNYRTVTVDGDCCNINYNVREKLDEIHGPFAALEHVKFNPDALAAIEPNTDSNSRKTFPLRLIFRAPQPLKYIVDTPFEDVEKAVESAILQGYGNRPQGTAP